MNSSGNIVGVKLGVAFADVGEEGGLSYCGIERV